MTGGPALFLPGPIPDRTVWAGWDRWRLTRRGFVIPQPQKRPKSSFIRFEADQPNEC